MERTTHHHDADTKILGPRNIELRVSLYKSDSPLYGSDSLRSTTRL
ncbi:MAG: hypothetical protein AAF550_09925 [Myxococcota bacterium]